MYPRNRDEPPCAELVQSSGCFCGSDLRCDRIQGRPKLSGPNNLRDKPQINRLYNRPLRLEIELTPNLSAQGPMRECMRICLGWMVKLMENLRSFYLRPIRQNQLPKEACNSRSASLKRTRCVPQKQASTKCVVRLVPTLSWIQEKFG